MTARFDLRVAADRRIAAVWRKAQCKCWAPRRTRRELLKARERFIGNALADSSMPLETLEPRLKAAWYRGAKSTLPTRIRELPDFRQLDLFKGLQ